MYSTILVALGGALGSVARYKLSGLVLHHTVDWRFPLATFIVNVVGCFVVGVLAALSEKHEVISPESRLLLFTGVAGGFTTFSAFGLETMFLLRRNEWAVAGCYVALSVIVGLAVMGLGFILVPAKAA
ncbi:MAG: fluoride efflux transporter CrcB [Planctomycetia bacterium]|nr:fluoride efflux transporter CrcB [Planctomycetia bacterium]